MPSPQQILESLGRIANSAWLVAVAWHIVLAAALGALAAGWRPTQRTALAATAAPAISVSVAAWVYGNPFNGTTFAGLGLVLLILAWRSRAPARRVLPGGRLARWFGAGLIALGMVYPHFLSGHPSFAYLYAAPVGLLPCPTLLVLTGLGLLGAGLDSRAWLVAVGLFGLGYGLLGWLRLGVVLDASLVAGALLLLPQVLQGKRAGRSGGPLPEGERTDSSPWRSAEPLGEAELLRRLRRAPGDVNPVPVDLARVADLPDCVAAYLRRTGIVGRPPIQRASLKHDGVLRVKLSTHRWSPFDAEQQVFPAAPGFVWEARVSLRSWLHLQVRDAFVEGEGFSEVRLLSRLLLAREHGGAPLSLGALHRYLAEAVWYPSALVPSERLRWRPCEDPDRAIATLTVGAREVSLEFRFDEEARVRSVYTPARYGRFGKTYETRPWRGRFYEYQERDGLLVPTQADVGWQLAPGQDVWWTFLKDRLDEVRYAR